jgi:small subunit ribosomal protein S1
VEESRAKADEEEVTSGEVADAGAANGAPRASRGARSGGSRQGGTPGAVTSTSTPGAGATGTLASDEALAALREKLSGGQS